MESLNQIDHVSLNTNRHQTGSAKASGRWPTTHTERDTECVSTDNHWLRFKKIKQASTKEI